MDADDTIAAADDAIIFDEGDDATDDVSDPFADLDDHGMYSFRGFTFFLMRNSSVRLLNFRKKKC